MGRPDFKSVEGRQTSLVGSTPTLFRHRWNISMSDHRNRRVAAVQLADDLRIQVPPLAEQGA